ncbi:MAG TPA: class I SAM-dependent methyltransferase [Candidatus Hydrogenedens sp.]|nr:class I SAM-dependent methyltransferase [Candidatus Hydrogenedens sp.]
MPDFPTHHNFTHQQKEIQSYFDYHAPHWDTHTSENILETAKKLLQHVNIEPNQTILDIGCGTGILVPYLWQRLNRSGTLIELDISQKMVLHGKEKFKGIPCHWLIADTHYLPIKPETIDTILCFAVFPHLIDKAQAIQEHSRVLRQGGSWVICHARHSKELNEFHKKMGGVVANHTIPEIDEIEILLNRANLHIQHFQDNDEGYLLIATY